MGSLFHSACVSAFVHSYVPNLIIVQDSFMGP